MLFNDRNKVEISEAVRPQGACRFQSYTLLIFKKKIGTKLTNGDGSIELISRWNLWFSCNMYVGQTQMIQFVWVLAKPGDGIHNMPSKRLLRITEAIHVTITQIYTVLNEALIC